MKVQRINKKGQNLQWWNNNEVLKRIDKRLTQQGVEIGVNGVKSVLEMLKEGFEMH